MSGNERRKLSFIPIVRLNVSKVRLVLEWSYAKNISKSSRVIAYNIAFRLINSLMVFWEYSKQTDSWFTLGQIHDSSWRNESWADKRLSYRSLWEWRKVFRKYLQLDQASQLPKRSFHFEKSDRLRSKNLLESNSENFNPKQVAKYQLSCPLRALEPKKNKIC